MFLLLCILFPFFLRAKVGQKPRYMGDFARRKIVYPNMTKFMPFVLDDEGYVTNQKCFIITGERLAFLTAFFNSSLFKYCFRDAFPELQGGTREMGKVFFDKIPVVRVSDEVEARFAAMVDGLRREYSREGAAEVDEALFDLYGLTAEERAAVGFIEIGGGAAAVAPPPCESQGLRPRLTYAAPTGF